MPTAMEVGLRQSTLPLGPMQPRKLLDIIDHLPEVEGQNPLRWMEGVTWEPYVCTPTYRVDYETDCAPNDMSASAEECVEWVTQTPFRIDDAMVRSTLDYTSTMLGERLVTRYYRHLSAAFAHALISGVGSMVSLSSVATAPSGAAFNAAATTVVLGFEILEQEIATRLQGAVGYIHCPPGLIGRFVMENGVRLNTAGLWETPAGNIVISDAGYVDPVPPTGGTVSTEANDWVYASGPVFYESTAPTNLGAGFAGFDDAGAPGTAWDRNTIVEYLSGYGILVFDPCPVTAVLIAYA